MKHLRIGSKGKDVEVLQHNLSRAGYLTKVDGDFGPVTHLNLVHFQMDHSLENDGIYGPITREVLMDKVAQHSQVPFPTPVSPSETPWMDWLARNMGEKEIPGNRANQFIVDLFRYTSLWGNPLALSDETAWCAATACAALEKNGYNSPKSAWAAHFDTFGEKLTEPKFGAIITVKTNSGSKRHVTFFVKKDANGNFVCRGGNQANMLKESTYNKDLIVEIRWPTKKKI